MNSKPSFEIRVTYSDWGEGMVSLLGKCDRSGFVRGIGCGV